MRGVLELGSGQAGAALNDAEQALRIEAGLTNARALKARALLALGRKDEAVAEAVAAARQDPEAPMIRQLLTEFGIEP